MNVQPTAQGNDFSVIPEQAVAVITRPGAFYAGMPRTGGYGAPLVFMLVLGLVAALIGLLLGGLGLGSSVAMGTGLVMLIAMPLGILIGGFIGAAFMVLLWRSMGSTQSYEAAYRCVAYASGILPITVIIGMIPYLGTIVSITWSTYLMIHASVAVHERPFPQAYKVFGILGVLLIALNLYGEYQTRQFTERFGTAGDDVDEMMQRMGDKSPEEMGRMFGEFMRGMEAGARNPQEPDATGQD